MLLDVKEVSEPVERRSPLKLSRNHMELAGLIVYMSVIGFGFALVLVLMLAPQ